MRKSGNLKLDFLELGEVDVKKHSRDPVVSIRAKAMEQIPRRGYEDNGQTEYRLIPGNPLYRAGTDGSIWSRRSGDWVKLKQHLNADGYLEINFKRQVPSVGEFRFYTPMLVHRLILFVFSGEPPANHISCHNDGVKTNNRSENLRWGTDLENSMDTIRHWINGNGPSLGGCKLNTETVIEIREARAKGASLASLAKEKGVTVGTIRDTVRRKYWKHVV